MILRTVAAWAALTVSVSPALAEDKKPKVDPEERSAKLEALIQEFVKARKESRTLLRSAKTDEERKAAEAKQPKEADFLPRVHLLIANNATDDVAVEALAFAVFGLDSRDQKVFDALSSNFVKSEKIRRFVQMGLGGAPDAVKPVLVKVLAENPSQEIKGLACFSLGNLAFEKPGDSAVREAELYFARVEKDFADVKAGGKGTLGEMAKSSLYELRHLQVGMKAPATTCRNLKGDKVSLSDHIGKVVVLDIWATWCGPCREMIPHERAMVEKFKSKPFSLISVSADDDKKELEDFLQKDPMPWTHWWDGAEAELFKQWNVRFFPTIYVLDAKGVIRYKQLRGEPLEKAVEKLLAEIPQ